MPWAPAEAFLAQPARARRGRCTTRCSLSAGPVGRGSDQYRQVIRPRPRAVRCRSVEPEIADEVAQDEALAALLGRVCHAIGLLDGYWIVGSQPFSAVPAS